jgi:hypothetical protein
VEDPNPVPGTPSLDLRLVRVNKDSNRLWYHLKYRNGEPERRGSEWEPIEILFKNSAYEPDFTHAPPQPSLAKLTQPLKCSWT